MSSKDKEEIILDLKNIEKKILLMKDTIKLKDIEK
jgi:hypothetical protein